MFQKYEYQIFILVIKQNEHNSEGTHALLLQFIRTSESGEI